MTLNIVHILTIKDMMKLPLYIGSFKQGIKIYIYEHACTSQSRSKEIQLGQKTTYIMKAPITSSNIHVVHIASK